MYQKHTSIHTNCKKMKHTLKVDIKSDIPEGFSAILHQIKYAKYLLLYEETFDTINLFLTKFAFPGAASIA